jgi:hypothetical protein
MISETNVVRIVLKLAVIATLIAAAAVPCVTPNRLTFQWQKGHAIHFYIDPSI